MFKINYKSNNNKKKGAWSPMLKRKVLREVVKKGIATFAALAIAFLPLGDMVKVSATNPVIETEFMLSKDNNNWVDNNVNVQVGDTLYLWASVHNTHVNTIAQNVRVESLYDNDQEKVSFLAYGSNVPNAPDRSNAFILTRGVNMPDGATMQYQPSTLKVYWDQNGDGTPEYNWQTFPNFEDLDTDQGMALGNLNGCNQYIAQLVWEVKIVRPQPNVIVVKNLTSNQPAYVGDTNVTFAIDVHNTGATRLDEVSLEDTFDPQYLEFVSASVAPTSVNQGTGKVVWSNVSPLNVTEQNIISVVFKALKATSPETTNVAKIYDIKDQYDQTVSDQSDPANVAILDIPQPGLSVTKTLTSADPAKVGDDVTFRIDVQNNGASELVNIPLTDDYDPAYLQYVSSDVTPDSTNSTQLIWNDLGGLKYGESHVINLTFKAVAATGTGRTINHAISSGAKDVFGQDADEAQGDASVQIIDTPLVEIVKTRLTESPVETGAQVTFDITVKNTGATKLVTVPLEDNFNPTYLTYQSASVDPDNTNDGVVKWDNIGPLTPGQSTSVTVVFDAKAAIADPGTLNVAMVENAKDELNQSAPDVSDDARVVIVGQVLGAESGLTITKDLMSENPAKVGDEVVFLVNLTNSGDKPLTSIRFADEYDRTMLKFVSATFDGKTIAPDYNNGGRTIWADVTGTSALQPGERIRVELKFAALKIGDTVNTAVAEKIKDNDGNEFGPFSDSASVKIVAKGTVLGASALPDTGPGMIVTLITAALGLAGLKLKRFGLA